MWISLTNKTAIVTKASPEERDWLRRYLTFPDPAAKWRGVAPEDAVKRLYEEVSAAFPGGLATAVVRAAKDEGIKVELIDLREVPVERDPDADLAWLYPYQAAALARGFERTRGIFHHATGAGKTELMVAFVRSAPCHWLFMAPNLNLVNNAADRFLKRNAEHGVDLGEPGRIGEGQWSEGEHLTCATYQSVYRAMRAPRGAALLARTGGMICDECFPAGTLVGERAIEHIRVGDLVPSHDPERGLVFGRVARLFRRQPKALVRLRFEGGASLVCTPEHPFLSSSGHYLAAESFCGNDMQRYEVADAGAAVRGVRDNAAPHDHEEARQGVLRPMPQGALGGAVEVGDSTVRHPAFARVVDVEVLQPGSDGTYGGLCPDGHVYNIEVERTHTYLVGREMFVAHNCHAVPAETFLAATRACNAYWRFGLSATPLVRGDFKSVLAMAALGTVIHHVAPAELVASGHTAKAHVRMTTVHHPMPDGYTYDEVYKELVVAGRARNAVLVGLAKKAPKPAFLFVKNIQHGRTLVALLQAAGINAAFVWGTHSAKQQATHIGALVRGALDVIVTSAVLKQGVDVPSLRSVIMGSSGKSIIDTIQKLGRGTRIERNAAGEVVKDEFNVYDVFDVGNDWLEDHAKKRRAAYVSEGYEVVVEGSGPRTTAERRGAGRFNWGTT